MRGNLPIKHRGSEAHVLLIAGSIYWKLYCTGMGLWCPINMFSLTVCVRWRYVTKTGGLLCMEHQICTNT